MFGNAGALFMTAMTWYDHSTGSIWSQPWGRAIQGELKGLELFLLPSQITTWSSWIAEHPGTLVMVNDEHLLGVFREQFDPDFVIGLILGEDAKGYYFRDVRSEGIINDAVGEHPVMLWADEENFHAYLRLVGEQELTFDQVSGEIRDRETGSRWDIVRGFALDGPLAGSALQPVPSTTAFDWAWVDFYPQSDFYTRN